MYKELYLALCQQLEPVSKFTDLWKFQTDRNREDEDYPHPSPSVFIEFEEFNWRDMADGSQIGEGKINFYIAIKNLADTHHKAKTQGMSLQVYDQLTAIHKQLHKFAAAGFSPLRRRASKHDGTFGGVAVYQLTYVTEFTDHSTRFGQDLVQPPNPLKLSFDVGVGKS